MADDDKIKVVTKDGAGFEMTVGMAKQSDTLSKLVEDIGVSTPIPLDSLVSGDIMVKIVEYMVYHHDNPEANETTEKWDKDFLPADQHSLFNLLSAAHYLGLEGLVDLICQNIADSIKGKTPEQIRTLYNIEDDLTAEEKAAITKEFEWCQEVH